MSSGRSSQQEILRGSHNQIRERTEFNQQFREMLIYRIGYLDGELSQLSEEIRNLQETNQRLKNVNRNLQQQNSELAAEISNLNTQIDSLVRERDDLTVRLQRLRMIEEQNVNNEGFAQRLLNAIRGFRRRRNEQTRGELEAVEDQYITIGYQQGEQLIQQSYPSTVSSLNYDPYRRG